MDAADWIGLRSIDVEVELVDQVVARAREARWDTAHVAAVEHPNPLVVQREIARMGFDVEIAVVDLREPSGDRAPKIAVRDVEQIGRAVLAGA